MADTLLIATHNKGKSGEFRELLRDIPFKLVTLTDVGVNLVAEETGQTYAENARLKATVYAAESGLLTLADDSGLEVDALGGEPGLKSARYAGLNASDADRVKLLLSRLDGLPRKERTACFKCVIAIATPAGEVALSEGECQGIITTEPRGTNGFGYDPIFLFPDWGKTMAELPPDLKGQISHRARAARHVPEILTRPPFSDFNR